MKAFPLELHRSEHWKPEVHAYLNQEAPFDHLTPYGISDDDILKCAANRSFNIDQRNLLVDSLGLQYTNAKIQVGSSPVGDNIEKLRSEKTFTVCTGQQLHIGLGPMYVFNKILSVITTCQRLNNRQSEYSFVPVYWLASEDHDIEEIQQFRVEDRLYTWNPEREGAVGRLPTSGLDELITTVIQECTSPIQQEWWETVRDAYQGHDSFSNATIELIHRVFGSYGLIVLDADRAALKRAMHPVLKADLTGAIEKGLEQGTKQVKQAGLKPQVGIQNCHFFYLEDSGNRIKIERNLDSWSAEEKTWTEQELLAEFDNHPERFSPNVVTRPCYQESILPNTAYLGGPGEISYWLQLPPVFKSCDTPFPVLGNRIAGMYAPSSWFETFTKTFTHQNTLLSADQVIQKHYPNHATTITALKDHISGIVELQESLSSNDERYVKKTRAKLNRIINDLEICQNKAITDSFKNQVNNLTVKNLFIFLYENGNLTERVLHYPPGEEERINIEELMEFFTDCQLVNNDIVTLIFN